MVGLVFYDGFAMKCEELDFKAKSCEFEGENKRKEQRERKREKRKKKEREKEKERGEKKREREREWMLKRTRKKFNSYKSKLNLSKLLATTNG